MIKCTKAHFNLRILFKVITSTNNADDGDKQDLKKNLFSDLWDHKTRCSICFVTSTVAVDEISLHTRDQGIVEKMNRNWWKWTEAAENETISWQGYGDCFLGWAWYNSYWLPRETKNNDCSILQRTIRSIRCCNQGKTTTFGTQKSSFIKTMHRHTKQLKLWPNWLNWSTNSSPTPRILQIWPPAIIICSQTWRDGSLTREFTQIERSLPKWTCILRSWAPTTIKKASNF